MQYRGDNAESDVGAYDGYRDVMDNSSSCVAGVAGTCVQSSSKVAVDARTRSGQSALGAGYLMPAHSQQRRRSHQVDFSHQCGMPPCGLTPGETASFQQGLHVKRKKRLSDVPVASLHAAHSPWGLRPAARFPGQQQQEHILVDDSNASMANSALQNAAALVDLQPLRSHQQHTSGFHQGHNPHEAAMRALKSMIWRLDPHTRMAFKDSLYRISRNTNVRVTGVGSSTPTSSVDHVVANLMYNRIAVSKHQCDTH
ncbi:g9761 [Coccomyxa elongata]